MSLHMETAAARVEIPSEVAMSSPESVALEMGAIVREAAQPSVLGEHIATAIDRAARRLGLNHRRAKAYWYGETKLIPAHEADSMRKARRQILREKVARLNAETELLQLKLRLLEGES